MELRPASYFVLASLLDGPLHGYAISARAPNSPTARCGSRRERSTRALDRMADRGLIEIESEETVEGRLRRYYRLTDGGRDSVLAEADRLASAARVVQARRTPPRHAKGLA